MTAATITTLVALGLFHGVNPAMGWLFAVALGLQEGKRAAVLRALPAIALGHAASVAAVVALVAAASAAISPGAVRVAGALALGGFGLYRLVVGGGHARWAGMRVGARDLVVWSFLMSSAHGAGLMLLPTLVPRDTPTAHAHAEHASHAAAAGAPAAVVLAVHSGAMLAGMAIAALVVHELAGLGFLRRAWINLDALWAGALVAAGVVTLAGA